MATTLPSPNPTPSLDAKFLAAFRAGTLTQQQAEAFVNRDPLELQFMLMQLSFVIAGKPPAGIHTPSGSIPPYAKPDVQPSSPPPKRGAKPGHKGVARPTPTQIDQRVVHQLPVCPCCNGPLHRTGRTRTRRIEDIPANLNTEVTEHTIHRDWCPTCKKQVEPIVLDALPNCQLGNRTVVLSAWLHFGLGNTTSQIVEVFNGHLHQDISEGGLTQIWHRLAKVLKPWYDEIQQICLKSAVLHADETSWRNAGLLCWMWCFACSNATYYLLHAKRGHEALRVFFTETFRGILVSDFWKAYDIVTNRQQKCWPHLLRDLSAVDDGRENGDDWPVFSKQLWGIYADAVQLELGIEAMEQSAYEEQVEQLHARIQALANGVWTNRHARRLGKRLAIYGKQLLCFLEYEDVPQSNNKAEREIRPAVLMRKASYGSASVQGAETRSILMSIYRTLKQRGLDPLAETEKALRQFIQTGKLPPLPTNPCSAG